MKKSEPLFVGTDAEYLQFLKKREKELQNQIEYCKDSFLNYGPVKHLEIILERYRHLHR